jgi:hypothetical protein
MRRLSEHVGEMMVKAIGELPVLEAARDQIEWEIVTFVDQGGTVGWLIGIGVPVPGGGDYIMPFTPLKDPHDQEQISMFVRLLYTSATQKVDEQIARNAAGSNGGKTSPGGLALP